MEDKLFSVKDKICIVTGGLGQLGKNYVRELHSRGAKVAVWGRTVNEKKIVAALGEEALRDEAGALFDEYFEGLF